MPDQALEYGPAGALEVQRRVEWGATVELRYRAVSFGRPVLQQKWIALRGAKGLSEWRDVPVEAVE